MRLHRQLLILSAALLAGVLPAAAQNASSQHDAAPVWLGVGLGHGTFRSLDPAPSAGREGLVASLEFGYRLNRDFGVGLEVSGLLPFSGCSQWECGENRADFAPDFSRFSAFAEYRPGRTGLRLRAGLGMSRFCYRSHWSDSAWSWFDALMVVLVDEDHDFGSGAMRCDAAQRALGGSVSVSYDWALKRAPATMGVRLSAEAANYKGEPRVDMPAFRHRAVMMSLHFTMQ